MHSKPIHLANRGSAFHTLMGVALVGCFFWHGSVAAKGPELARLVRDTYRTIDDCQRDWGYAPGLCSGPEKIKVAGIGMTTYLGPTHYFDRNLGYPVIYSADGQKQVRQDMTRERPNSGGEIDVGQGPEISKRTRFHGAGRAILSRVFGNQGRSVSVLGFGNSGRDDKSAP